MINSTDIRRLHLEAFKIFMSVEAEWMKKEMDKDKDKKKGSKK